MSADNENTKFEQLVRRIDPSSKLRRTWPLTGGVSAQVTAFEFEQTDGQTRKLVVRQHGAADLVQNPHLAAAEFRLLQLLRTHHLPVPAPYYLDQSSQIFPTPFIVVEYIKSTPEDVPPHLPDLIFQLATHLARIHSLTAAAVDLSFLPQQEKRAAQTLRDRPAAVESAFDEGRIRAILESVWPLPPRNPTVLLHGDFWPGNILWQEGRLVAIIDWEDAATGDPLADLANSRLELLWAYGRAAMRRFTRQYQALAPLDCSHLLYWDLYAALRPMSKIATWGLDPPTEKRMRTRLRWFIKQAFDMLSKGD